MNAKPQLSGGGGGLFSHLWEIIVCSLEKRCCSNQVSMTSCVLLIAFMSGHDVIIARGGHKNGPAKGIMSIRFIAWHFEWLMCLDGPWIKMVIALYFKRNQIIGCCLMDGIYFQPPPLFFYAIANIHYLQYTVDHSTVLISTTFLIQANR